MYYKHLSQFADTYDCSTYGSGSYNVNEVCGTMTGIDLSATGTNVAIGVGIGIILIVAAVVMFIRLRKKSIKS